MFVDSIVFKVARIECYVNGGMEAEASGFFYEIGEALYLVTNRHVVIDDDDCLFPDELRVLLHTNPQNLGENGILSIPLYQCGLPVWLEHPTFGSEVDVVAVPVDARSVRSQFLIQAFNDSFHLPNNPIVSLGQDLIVLGYPLGLYDTMHNLPLVRNATVASTFGVPFQGKQYFLVDSRLHSGSSGSAVLTKPSPVTDFDGNMNVMAGRISYLVGVFSASLDSGIRDPDEDEPLDLNYVWFAELIPQIILGGSTPNVL